MNYEQYLQSEEWRSLRLRVLERDGHQCQTCLHVEDLEVHHKTYERLGCESLEDLITLCRECHEAVTTVIRRRRYGSKAIQLESVQRITPVANRGMEYAEIEVSSYVRIAPHSPQRTDSRSDESFFQGIETGVQQERQDGRRF